VEFSYKTSPLKKTVRVVIETHTVGAVAGCTGPPGWRGVSERSPAQHGTPAAAAANRIARGAASRRLGSPD